MLEMRRASDADAVLIERLLLHNGLPHQDVGDKPECFFLFHDAGELVGIGGLELHGDCALLRSLVVAPDRRGCGHGKAIARALLAEAARRGVGEVYLLTLTAERLFAGLGFERIERAAAPESMQRTTEFASLCPDTAACMRARVAPAIGP